MADGSIRPVALPTTRYGQAVKATREPGSSTRCRAYHRPSSSHTPLWLKHSCSNPRSDHLGRAQDVHVEGLRRVVNRRDRRRCARDFRRALSSLSQQARNHARCVRNDDAELVRRVSMAAQGAKDAADEMRRRMRTLLDLCKEEDIRSIVYQRAPRILGSGGYRAADEGYAIGGLVDLVQVWRGGAKSRDTMKIFWRCCCCCPE